MNKIPGKEKDMFVLGKETQSVFVETNGEPVANCDIVKWTDIPVGVGKFVLPLRRGTLERSKIMLKIYTYSLFICFFLLL